MHHNAFRRASRAVACVSVLSLAACMSAEEQERRATEAMVAQAKIDIAAESAFVQDSTKLAASFTIDTVLSLRMLQRQATDRDGVTWTDTVYQIFTRDSAKCMVEPRKYHLLTSGDTLTCQWETRK